MPKRRSSPSSRMTCARCGREYNALPPSHGDMSSLCDVCELSQLLNRRPTPEETEIERLNVALGHAVASEGAAPLPFSALTGLPSPAICALLGVPLGVRPQVHFYWGDGFRSASDATRWADFRAELLAVARDALGWDHPWIEAVWPQPEPLVLIRWRVWRVGALGVLQTWFDPNERRERRRADDVDSVGLGELEGFLNAVKEERAHGRIIGSGVPPCSGFLGHLAEAYTACEKRSGRRPTALEVAAEMDGMPYSTFRDRCRRCHVNWRTYSP